MEADAILLSGKNPYKGIGAMIGDDIFKKKISVIGYFYKIDSTNDVGKVPVFYIKDWHALN